MRARARGGAWGVSMKAWNTWFVLSILFSGLVGLSVAGLRSGVPGRDPCRGLVQQALADSERIKPGMKRREVEKYFRYAGGLQFPGKAFLIHPKCEYLKLEVEFEVATNELKPGVITSPEDTVVKTSKLVVSYPTMD